MSLSEDQAYMILNALPGMGPITLNRLLEVFSGSPLEVLQAPVARLCQVHGVGEKTAQAIAAWSSHFDPSKEAAKLERMGAEFLPVTHARYPDLLRRIHDPPIGLYVLGKYAFQHLSVAIVGSRRTTLYGQRIARQLARDLSAAGICVVSGLARGIDTSAHQGVLEAGGSTVAVLGCGLDIIYPPENIDLFRLIPKDGAILSEFPLGRRADRQTFPMRNRVVSGMCAATIVVESDQNGGAMITANFAADQNRTVMAVPGRVDQATSRGCHALIREGAVLVTSADEVLEELGYRKTPELPGLSEHENTRTDLGPAEAKLWQALRDGDRLHADDLAHATGLEMAEVSTGLMLLELKRLIRKRLDGSFECC